MSAAAARMDQDFRRMVEWVHDLAPWKVFFTGTFEGEYSVPSAQRAFERFAKRHLRDSSWFYVLEPNPSRAGHHVHALLGDCPELHRKTVWKLWKERYGRNKFEPIRDPSSVASYCSKHLATEYLLKGGGWWNFKVNPNRDHLLR